MFNIFRWAKQEDQIYAIAQYEIAKDFIDTKGC